MDNQTQNQRPTDEIDLFEFSNRIGKSLKNIFFWSIDTLKKFSILIVRKTIWILTFMIIGFLVCYFLFYKTDNYLSAGITIRSNAVNSSFIVNLINSGDFLETSSLDIKKIKSISAFYGIDYNHDKITDIIDYNNTFNPKDTTQKRLPDILYVKINFFDQSILKSVADNLFKFISSNKYIIDNNNIRIQQSKNLIEEYKKEIQLLDSIEKTQFSQSTKQQRFGSNQTIILNEKDIKLYHREIISLFKLKQVLEKDLILYSDPITIIQDSNQKPTLITTSNWSSLNKVILLFGIIGFIVSLLWQNRGSIWELVREAK
jgi:hypothetical protein